MSRNGIMLKPGVKDVDLSECVEKRRETVVLKNGIQFLDKRHCQRTVRLMKHRKQLCLIRQSPHGDSPKKKPN